MTQLTPDERLIWRQLRNRARDASTTQPEAACIHYRDLGLLVDPDGRWHYPMSRPPFRGFNDALGHVSQYEHGRGRPLLSSLVTTMDDGQPGKGFALFAVSLGFEVVDPEPFWRRELTRTVAFWSSMDDTLLLDAAVDRVLSAVDGLSDMLRNRG
ncbi:hypothetical protein [Amycolatopsis sp. NPDC051061]|uniref:hypothetical protein n=1 Tax=Amycolatopsis sp. NPDC051061 TaxID=3155042 RepID=UPI003430890C